jgi:radical SAM superfamily enzyme with C-terminal helix-hairpin-helix motif
MVEANETAWLVIDGYEDEPAAFGVPPYIGFHIRYLCGVLEQANIDYEYITIDAWRTFIRKEGEEAVRKRLANIAGLACIAGAVVPGRYLRGTPISLKETRELIRSMPAETPAVFGGWAIRGWRQQGKPSFILTNRQMEPCSANC